MYKYVWISWLGRGGGNNGLGAYEKIFALPRVTYNYSRSFDKQLRKVWEKFRISKPLSSGQLSHLVGSELCYSPTEAPWSYNSIYITSPLQKHLLIAGTVETNRWRLMQMLWMGSSLKSSICSHTITTEYVQIRYRLLKSIWSAWETMPKHRLKQIMMLRPDIEYIIGISGNCCWRGTKIDNVNWSRPRSKFGSGRKRAISEESLGPLFNWSVRMPDQS